MDTAGQEIFRTITSSYYRGAHAIMLCYDVTNRESFTHIKNWLTECDRYASENVTKIIIGNKCDANTKRQVIHEEGRKFAELFGLEFIETSAKTNLNIDKAFTKLAELVMKNKKEFVISPKPSDPFFVKSSKPIDRGCC